jgi:hypothetical protein
MIGTMLRCTHAILLSAFACVFLGAALAAVEETDLVCRCKLPMAQSRLLEFLRVEEAWHEIGDAPDCRVGVLDGGFDFCHSCLNGVPEASFFAGGMFHLGSSKLINYGTAMASLIAAQRVDLKGEDGMEGLAPSYQLLAASTALSPLLAYGMREFIDEQTCTESKGLIAEIQDSPVDLGESGRANRFGHGRIDFLAAIKLARQR